MPRIYKDGVLYNTSPSTASQLPYDSNTSTKDKIDSKADSSSLASPSITGSTNNTGSTIEAETFFYLNGELVRAKTKINNAETLTLNTNYAKVTTGSLNVLKSRIDTIYYNANTDRNTESNRTNVMIYLINNAFRLGCFRAVVRYTSGYYHSYIAFGPYGSQDYYNILETTHALSSNEKMILWSGTSSALSKLWSVS